jgi:hypothetical protein
LTKASKPATAPATTETAVIATPLASDATLRDFFAAQASPPPLWWLSSLAAPAGDIRAYADCITQWGYIYADSMLTERQK